MVVIGWQSDSPESVVIGWQSDSPESTEERAEAGSAPAAH